LSGVPGVGTVHLLLYDISGEAFDTTGQLGRHAFYVPRSEVITLILSLEDLKSGQELAFLLARLVESIRLNGQTPDETSLVVVLTKGDRLKADVSLPKSAQHFLSKEVPTDPRNMEQLQILSDDLEQWLTNHPENYWNFVENAKADFATVRYTAISAIGSDPRKFGAQIELNPRNVVSPLLWLFRLSLPTITVREEERKYTFHDFFEASRVAVTSSKQTEIELGAGRFLLQQSVKFNKTVVLKGAGKDKTQLVVNKPNVRLSAAGARLHADGISIVMEGSAVGSALTISGSRLELTNCTFVGGISAGRRRGNGLWITGKSIGEIRKCSFYSNQGDGLAVSDTAQVDVQDCSASRNQHAGFAFSGAAEIVSTRNLAFENQAGFHLTDNVKATIKNCKAFNNRQCGIVCLDDATGVLESNVCRNYGGQPGDPKQAIGILLSGNSIFVVVENQCTGQRKDGIAAVGKAKPEIRHNVSDGNAVCGIGVYERACAFLDENNCSRNLYGIYVQSTAQGTKVGRKNKCFGNSRYPIQNLRAWAWKPIAFWANLFNDSIGPNPPV